MTNQIRYLPNHEIDKLKWDQCINTAVNGLIYGYSYYLDFMSKQWGGLVLGDYEAVMPLTWNKKYGIFYLYQPFLTASLGVFGRNVDSVILESFLLQIPRKFRYWDIHFNYGNLFPLQSFNMYERMNHVLQLNRPYDDIVSNYRGNVRRIVNKAFQLGCTARKDIEVGQVIDLSVGRIGKSPKSTKEDFLNFRRLYHFLQSRNKAVTYGIFSPQEQLLASGVFLFSHKRAYYILAGNHPNGKTLGASHAMIDSFIRDHSRQDMLLDFEGSNISKIAFFFKGFGATEEKYPGILHNRLPVLVRWMKSER